MWARLRSWCAALLGRARFEASLDDELDAHVRAHAADLIERGVPRAEAYRRAQRELGSVAGVKDRCRDAAGLRLADEVVRDARVGWRGIVRAPLTSGVALVTIAVATGLVILTAALVYSVLLRPLPFPDAGRLMAITPAASEFEALDLRAFRDAQSSFAQVHGYYRRSATLTADGAVPESLDAAFVTAGLFDMLGTPPLLGRTFRTGEDFTPDAGVIVIGEQLWRGRFGADPAILERTLVVDGRRVRVVGVLPASVRFPVDEDAWLPMDFAWPTADEPGSGRSFQVVGRLRPTATPDAADAEARVLFARIWTDRETAASAPGTPRVAPFAGRYLQAGFPWLLLVTALAAAGVLVVACANVATLTLARAMSRRTEVAVRLALGAGRLRIARQLAVESLVLAVPATLAGLWLAAIGLRVFERFQPGLALPYWAALRLDPPVLLLAGALTLAVAVAASLAPALRATRGPGRLADASPGRGATRRGRAMPWLAAAQVTGACAFLVAAGLLVRSTLNVDRLDLGFDATHVVTGQVVLPGSEYPDPSDTMQRLVQQVASAPGVDAASVVRAAPGTGPGFAWSFAVEGETYGPGRPHPAASGLPAASGFFETMGIPVVDGRDFSREESRYGTPPVLIASETLARRYLGPDPTGRRIQIGDTGEGPWLPVVGVVADTHLGSRAGGIGMATEPTPQLYLSWGAAPYAAATLVVRTSTGTPATALPAIGEAVAAVAPSVALRGGVALTDTIDASTWAIRLFGLAFAVFGGVTLLMSAVGLFGVMAFAVRERTREIGVRMALGARPRAVLRTILGTVAAPVPLGLAAGLAASVPLGRALRLLLFDVPAVDGAVYALVATVLTLTALLAACGPALAATRVDPVTALRID